MRNEKQKNHQPPRIMVKDSLGGLKGGRDLVADIILSELTENSKKIFSEDKQSSIMDETDNSQIDSSKRLTA